MARHGNNYIIIVLNQHVCFHPVDSFESFTGFLLDCEFLEFLLHTIIVVGVPHQIKMDILPMTMYKMYLHYGAIECSNLIGRRTF